MYIDALWRPREQFGSLQLPLPGPASLASNDIIFASNDIASNALLKDRKIENVDYCRKGDERTKIVVCGDSEEI